MRLTRPGIAVVGLWLALMLAAASAAQAQALKYFTGKIASIAQAMEMEPGKQGKFYVVKLEEYPTTNFRVSTDEAVRSGIVDTAGTTAIVTPKMGKGVGWKVKLTCEGAKMGELSSPTYRVKTIERLSD